MSTVRVAVIGGLVLASAVLAQIALAQTPAPAGKRSSPAATQVSGTIKSIDPAGRTILLVDGTRLVIPESVGVNPADLKPGATVRASVEDKGGQKVVTTMQVN
jgi:hypothetical protein